MSLTKAQREVRERLRAAIMSAATLMQNDPDIGEETLDFLDTDIQAAMRAFKELQDES